MQGRLNSHHGNADPEGGFNVTPKIGTVQIVTPRPKCCYNKCVCERSEWLTGEFSCILRME